MKIATIIVRVLLGLMFAIFGSNAFLHFMPMPPLKGHAAEFMAAMGETGYMQAIAAFQVAGGLILLLGRFVPLGLPLLAPVTVNIVLYHIFIPPTGLPVAIVVALLSLFLLWRHRAT